MTANSLKRVLDPDNPDPRVWADSAYRSRAQEQRLEAATYVSQIHEKGAAQCPLSPEAQARNRERSRTRATVEHVFGFIETSLGGKLIRTIGLARATVKIGLMNLVYNMRRYVFIQAARAAAALTGAAPALAAT